MTFVFVIDKRLWLFPPPTLQKNFEIPFICDVGSKRMVATFLRIPLHTREVKAFVVAWFQLSKTRRLTVYDSSIPSSLKIPRVDLRGPLHCSATPK